MAEDFKGRLFQEAKALLALADNMVEIKTVDTVIKKLRQEGSML